MFHYGSPVFNNNNSQGQSKIRMPLTNITDNLQLVNTIHINPFPKPKLNVNQVKVLSFQDHEAVNTATSIQK